MQTPKVILPPVRGELGNPLFEPAGRSLAQVAVQLGIAIGIQRPLAVALTIFGHAEPEPPAALIRCWRNNFT